MLIVPHVCGSEDRRGDGDVGTTTGAAAGPLATDHVRRRDQGRKGHKAKLKKVEEFGLVAVTANTTCWSSAKEFLMSTDAHLVFVQEHKLFEQDIPQASQWCDA